MASEVKRCVQCGLLKNVEEFRKYPYSAKNNTNGRYRICRTCESVNTTYRNTVKMISLGDLQPDKLESLVTLRDKIEALYELLEQKGFRVPVYGEKQLAQKALDDTSTSAPTVAIIENLSAFYGSAEVPKTTVATGADVPSELRQWLEADPADWIANNLSPEYLQETIYESLKAKYRPQTGIDKNTYLPLYDDTYKDELNKILRRFDEYEEAFSMEEE